MELSSRTVTVLYSIVLLWTATVLSSRTVLSFPIFGVSQKEDTSTSSSSSTKFYYRLGEENNGFFRGEWSNNMVSIFDRVPAVLKRRKCHPPPSWIVDKFLDESTEQEDSQSISTRSIRKFLAKRFFFMAPTTSCGYDTMTATIRDERPEHIQRQPVIHTVNTTDTIRLRVYTSDLFHDEEGKATYPANKEVVWHIHNPTDKAVSVHFSTFDLGEGSECSDYVSIHNSHGNIFKLCGNNAEYKNSTIQLFGENITIKLVTSAFTGSATGFSADVVIV